MENYDNEVFGFGNGSNEELENASDFNYDSISGLGESNYENEDLFSTEVDNNTDYDTQTSSGVNTELNNNVNYNYQTSPAINSELDSNVNYNYQPDVSVEAKNENNYNTDKINDFNTLVNNYEGYSENYIDNVVSNLPEVSFDSVDTPSENVGLEQDANLNVEEGYRADNSSADANLNVEPSTEFVPDQMLTEDNNLAKSEVVEEQNTAEETPISMSDTPIEELNDLTKYEEDNITNTDISDLFNKVSVNVKDASDIFKRNTDLKNKIDSRFEELKKLQSEIESSRKSQKDEIDKYKDEVLQKLTEKKDEIEKRLNLLKESQANLEKEKQEFEQYKKNEQENIDKVQKEVQAAYDDRREELSHIEDVLRRQKDALDEERSQLSLDKIQYEADKNELANNLLKFNDLVNSFTNGVGDIKE